MIRTLFVFAAITMSVSAAVTIQKASYGGWPNCYRITNGEVELIVTTDVGPRVLRYSFVKGQNLFKEFQDQLGKSGERTWQPRGGHRLWMAPERVPDTYALDNSPAVAVVNGAVLEVTQPVEPETGLEKTIVVKLAAAGTDVEVLHRIKNTATKARHFAPWALTMMAQGGTGISGFPPRGTHPEVLAPTNPLVMWAFSDLSDKRWTFTKKYMMLRQDPGNTGQPQKLGLFNKDTFGAYLLGSDLFVKKYKADPSKSYPDFGCSFETFTNAEFLELETLGPLENVPSGATVEHTERWTLHSNVKIASWTDAELDRVLLPLVK
jgi:hypothetical protein